MNHDSGANRPRQTARDARNTAARRKMRFPARPARGPSVTVVATMQTVQAVRVVRIGLTMRRAPPSNDCDRARCTARAVDRGCSSVGCSSAGCRPEAVERSMFAGHGGRGVGVRLLTSAQKMPFVADGQNAQKMAGRRRHYCLPGESQLDVGWSLPDAAGWSSPDAAGFVLEAQRTPGEGDGWWFAAGWLLVGSV